MPKDPVTMIFVGIKNSVLALDARSGEEIWRTKLKGSDFVTILWDGESLVAANNGEVFGLDWRSGTVTWHNQMKGLGLGVVSLASSRSAGQASHDPAIAVKKRHEQAAATAAT